MNYLKNLNILGKSNKSIISLPHALSAGRLSFFFFKGVKL